MKVHFIAIGGSAMHNLAIALKLKGYEVTGSDDEIFEPSKSRLEKYGLCPSSIGWNEQNITPDLDAIILGMHARSDNPELQKAKELNINVYSYPEYLFEQSKEKIRIVIGGSHGKTTITSMLLHAFKVLDVKVDYMVGAQLEGYECMVSLSEEAKYIVLEGDEYLSSPIDRRPKFHLYKPHIALISGIAWDHINVFPTFEEYVDQFRTFCKLIEPLGTLIYNEEDAETKLLGIDFQSQIKTIGYKTPEFSVKENGANLAWNSHIFSLSIFGAHNMQNLVGAMRIAEQIGVDNFDFLEAMKSFKGAGKRLQKVIEFNDFILFKDFAHSPSKLKATISAVKNQYRSKRVIACMELHTFSSLQSNFLPLYQNAMEDADFPLVYFNPEVVEHKKLPPITKEEVCNGFGGNIDVVNSREEVITFINEKVTNNSVVIMMSSGNFDGIDYDSLANDLCKIIEK